MTAPIRSAAPPWIVFTDLDGTLLDAHSYDAGPARGALDLLTARGVPVIFCSSKTAAEQRPLRAVLGLSHLPFIVENGAAVLVPAASALPVTDWPRAVACPTERLHALGRSAEAVRAGIARAASAAGLSVTGYADLTVEAVAELTGLDLAAAARARQREFSETLIDRHAPEQWSAFAATLAAEGLGLRHGGRFHTVTDLATDKGRAVRLVAELFSRQAGHAIATVGLGDSANDEGLLAAVDQAWLVARPDGSWTPLEIPGLRRVPHAGPTGWAEAIRQLLSPP
jgi:mannosyl-3-phosphoglycerate phosphatase family protein